MPKLLELKAAQGIVLFQVPAGEAEVEAASRTGEVVQKIAKSMGEVLGIVGEIAQGFHDSIKDAPVETAQLEFGLQFTVKGRLYVVDVGAESAIKVTLTVHGGTAK
jgi:hypothetical protein